MQHYPFEPQPVSLKGGKDCAFELINDCQVSEGTEKATVGPKIGAHTHRSDRAACILRTGVGITLQTRIQGNWITREDNVQPKSQAVFGANKHALGFCNVPRTKQYVTRLGLWQYHR